ncbi:MAG: LysE family transporter [Bacillota bacterium]|nr:LysE family transporter [Candidatus Fermentithermobacillaceae bacterium]
MGILGLIATAFVVGLSGAMGPGSLLVVVVTETVKRGFWAGPAAIAGHAAVEIAMMFLLRVGLGKVLAYKQVLGTIGLLGGVMLFYFGRGTVKTARTATLSLDTSETKTANGDLRAKSGPSGHAQRGGFMSTALAGMAASISNPYWVIWWATVGAAYVATSATYGPIGPGAFFLGHIAADLAWYSLVAFAIATGTRFFNDRVYRGILYVCGALLFLFGGYFLNLGFQNIRL